MYLQLIIIIIKCIRCAMRLPGECDKPKSTHVIVNSTRPQKTMIAVNGVLRAFFKSNIFSNKIGR